MMRIARLTPSTMTTTAAAKLPPKPFRVTATAASAVVPTTKIASSSRQRRCGSSHALRRGSSMRSPATAVTLRLAASSAIARTLHVSAVHAVPASTCVDKVAAVSDNTETKGRTPCRKSCPQMTATTAGNSTVSACAFHNRQAPVRIATASAEAAQPPVISAIITMAGMKERLAPSGHSNWKCSANEANTPPNAPNSACMRCGAPKLRLST